MNPDPIMLVGGHLDNPPAFAESIIRAVGLAALSWGRLEQHLDTLLISVNKEEFKPKRFRQTPATSFRLKIDLFAEWFVKDPRFAQYHERARRLKTSLKHASQDRVLLFHSNLQGFIEGPPVKMVTINVHIEGEYVKQDRGEWTEDQVIDFGRKVRGLNVGLRTISHEVLTPDFLESLEST